MPVSALQCGGLSACLLLIASVFYHDALLSPTRSLGSCQRAPLSASHVVWQRKYRPVSLSRLPLPHPAVLLDRREPGRVRERCNGLSLPTIHNTRNWPHCMPSPHGLALCWTSTGPLCSPLQMLQSVNGADTMKTLSVHPNTLIWGQRVKREKNDGGVETVGKNEILYNIFGQKYMNRQHRKCKRRISVRSSGVSTFLTQK